MTMLRATPHFTVLVPIVVPTPMIDEQITSVALTGMPAADAPRMVTAPAVSAAKPWTGRSLVILYPMVLTIRHPPASVPSAMVVIGCDDDPGRDKKVIRVGADTGIPDDKEQGQDDADGLRHRLYHG